jgi:hypothetical protein
MHTLYSKSFWETIQIPESFGGYGPEDTYSMTIASWLQQKGYPIRQYILDGIYIAEDIHRKTPSFSGKLVSFDKKNEFYTKAMGLFAEETSKFVEKMDGKSNP